VRAGPHDRWRLRRHAARARPHAGPPVDASAPEQRDGLAQGVEPVAALLGVLPPAQDRKPGGGLGESPMTRGFPTVAPIPVGDLTNRSRIDAPTATVEATDQIAPEISPIRASRQRVSWDSTY
jgi:hypothetical protein